jgi:HEAT repeat protein
MLLVVLAGYLLFREPPEDNPAAELMDQLQHADVQQRLAAARALRKLGPQASEAIPLLVEKLGNEPNEDLRAALAEALISAGPGASAHIDKLLEIKQRETHPGVLQIIEQLCGK